MDTKLIYGLIFEMNGLIFEMNNTFKLLIFITIKYYKTNQCLLIGIWNNT